MSATDPPRASRLRWLVQIVGFGIGVGLLAWCARVALSDSHRAQLERLEDASAGAIAGLLGLSVAILLINGLAFWIMLRPVRRLEPVGVIATSCIATFLALLPFKLSIALRVLVHHRRDGVPLMLIGGWFGALGVVFIGTIALVAGIAYARARFSLDTGATVGAGLGAGILGVIGLLLAARVFRADSGRERMIALAERMAIGPLGRPVGLIVRSRSFEHLHRAFDMLSHPGAVVGSVVIRLLDVALQSVRFTLAGAVVGVSLDVESAVLLACAHASIGVVSPFGTLGTREAGTLGLAA
ncbi:MAG: hypothetical protein AAGK04_11670, partial [Planctomycetota bacterium]